MSYINIKRIHLVNYKAFADETIQCNANLNIYVGDNGTGKSSMLQAIDLALSGSSTKVDSLDIENILNAEAVDSWLNAPKIENLPRLIIEIFLNNVPDEPKFARFYGEKFSGNSVKNSEFGIKLVCEPNPDFGEEISDLITKGNCVFPYEFYISKFTTFADMPYSSYMRPFHLMNIDNSAINTEKTLRYVIENTYAASVSEDERIQIRQKFRTHINQFQLSSAAVANGITISADLESALNLQNNGVMLNNQGQGKISICKTESALHKDFNDSSVFLIEEPENHLSHTSLRYLINRIQDLTNGRQLFIATHSSYIATRLGLKNVYFINKSIKSLSSLSEETSAFFMKIPNDNLLQCVLSQNVLLVEGAAEYILMDYFFQIVTNQNADHYKVWIVSLNNLSFKRYMELGRILGTNIAIVRDNDGQSKQWYSEYVSDRINVFTDPDLTRRTFDTSRCGTKNTNLHNDYDNYKARFEQFFSVDESSLSFSYRCSDGICAFIRNSIKIQIYSACQDNTSLQPALIQDKEVIRSLMENSSIKKLFYNCSKKYSCNASNWGDCKGLTFGDVCVILNENTYKLFCSGELEALPSISRNKFFVACTRASGQLCFIREKDVAEYKMA